MNDRVVLVTGVSRRIGIGFTLARTLLDAGAKVFAQSWAPHDDEHPWGADPDGAAGAIGELGGESDRLAHVEADFADPEAPAQVVKQAVERFGHVDALVVNHARSALGTLDEVTAADLDLAWAVNGRASVLLTQAFAAQHDGRPGGRVVLFTSGQHLSPMSGELPYAISKGAIHQMTLSLSATLMDRGITVNTINPGPVDTGYAEGEFHRAVADAFPLKRWGQPDDVARLVLWLVSDEARWITGQVINSDGGFRHGKL
ncbi:SDR family oxidoreductase [Sinosporangium siamense]|uniref:SDR family oxidoreductase n=1 Tax=Sinosporangium siamense TaxID=1367973 RepID=UPI00194FC5DB|nr:SDR family oxidoreductase [Sinosporangium siamense]